MDDDITAAGKMAERLFLEVLTQGHGASLPSALSDVWLRRARESCEKVFADLPENPTQRDCEVVASSMLMMLVMHTLHDRGDVDVSKQGVPLDVLHECMKLYFIEVQLESLRRKGLVQSSRATVDDIFDPNRKIQYSGPLINAVQREANAMN